LGKTADQGSVQSPIIVPIPFKKGRIAYGEGIIAKFSFRKDRCEARLL